MQTTWTGYLERLRVRMFVLLFYVYKLKHKRFALGSLSRYPVHVVYTAQKLHY